jgi:citrate lyase subunit beta/citryl-CoA lyase
VVADLEDAVAPAEKGSARDLVVRVRPRVVRVNGADTRFFADDMAAVGELELDALVLPKATGARVIEAYEQAQREGRGVLPLNGAMVDLPVVTRARRLLAEAERR